MTPVLYGSNPSRFWRYVGITAAVGAGVAVTLYAVRAFARGKAPPVTGPLRPPSGAATGATKSPGVPMGPPGPLASQLAKWIDKQDDDELARLSAALPRGWWEKFVIAAQMPTDAQYLIVLNPILIDVSLLGDDATGNLGREIISAVGLPDALALKEIIEDSHAAAVA